MVSAITCGMSTTRAHPPVVPPRHLAVKPTTADGDVLARHHKSNTREPETFGFRHLGIVPNNNQV
jgi:hypothetical protein